MRRECGKGEGSDPRGVDQRARLGTFLAMSRSYNEPMSGPEDAMRLANPGVKLTYDDFVHCRINLLYSR